MRSSIQVPYRSRLRIGTPRNVVIGGWPWKPDDRGSSAIQVSRIGLGSSIKPLVRRVPSGLTDCPDFSSSNPLQELFQQAISADDTQRGVPGVRDISRAVAAVQQRAGTALARSAVGCQKAPEPFLSCQDQRRLLDKLAHQQLNRQPLITVGIRRDCRSRLAVPALSRHVPNRV